MRRINHSIKKALRDQLIRLSWSLPIRGYPLHGYSTPRPFFIIGSGRSGTTLLRRILLAHPHVHIPPETYVLGQVITTFRRWRAAHWSDLVYLTLSKFEYHPEFEAFGITLRALAKRLVKLEPADRSLARILDEFYRYHAEHSGRSDILLWGDKTPINTFWLSEIESVFPDARYIHLIRDGVDSSTSYLRSGIYPTLEAAASRWKASVKAASAHIELVGERGLEIRYELLASNPEPETRRICDFLGIGFDNIILASEKLASGMGDVPRRAHHSKVFDPIDAKSIGSGRQDLDESDARMLQTIIGDELHRQGYEAIIK